MLTMMLAVLAVSSSGVEPRLSVRLRLIDGHTVELRIRNMSAQRIDAEVSSAFMLMPVDSSEDAVPNRRLWGPAHPTTGRSYDRAIRVGPSGTQPPPDPEPRLLLNAKQSATTVVDLDALKWQLAHLSVWPNRTLADAAEAGEHFLWFELETGSESVRSNKIRIAVAGRRGRPTRR